jgi:hypothetical protein
MLHAAAAPIDGARFEPLACGRDPWVELPAELALLIHRFVADLP